MEKFMAAGKPHDWYKYHKLPEKLNTMNNDPNATPQALFMEKD